MKKPADIKNMEEKIEAFKKKQKPEGSSLTPSSSVGAATKGFQLSIELISGVFIGSAIGYFLDTVFSTFPWCLAVFTIFGGAAGILNMYRSAKGEQN